MTHLPTHIGRYEILGLLGTGGMAEVFLGRFHAPANFDRPVVVKRILPHLARQRHFVDMFRDEARIAARIDHPNVVHVRELGESASRELYLVMEYLAGESAAGVARQLLRRKKLLSFGLCAHLMAEVCAGLHAAHELVDDNGSPLQIVHRDVSPANIFITYRGEVKILDFGIAVAADRLSRTDAGQVKGKYAYMSPEQCRGKTLDRRSDIFSLGTVLYELSTCRRLFKRSSDMETLEAVCNETVVPPSQLVNQYPPELERICLKALAKEPEDRYPTALEMRCDLLALAQSLNKAKQPDLALAKVMRRLFAERIQQKSDMLGHLQAGDELSSESLQVEDKSIELPAVPRATIANGAGAAAALAEPLSFVGNTQELPPVTPGPTTNTYEDGADTSVASRSPWSFARGLMLALTLVVGVAVGVWVTAAQAPKRAVPSSAGVRVELETIPSGARVYRDGRLEGETPIVLTMATGDEAVELTLRKEGFADLVDRIVPKTDQKLRLSLQALEPDDEVGSTQPDDPPPAGRD